MKQIVIDFKDSVATRDIDYMVELIEKTMAGLIEYENIEMIENM